MTLADVEIITPEGRFASIRVPTVIDAFAAGFYKKDAHMGEVLLSMCTTCVTLDGEKVTQETLGNLPMYEIAPITAKLVELMGKPLARGKA